MGRADTWPAADDAGGIHADFRVARSALHKTRLAEARGFPISGHIFRGDELHLDNPLQRDLGELVRLPDIFRGGRFEKTERLFLGRQERRAQVPHRLSLSCHLSGDGFGAGGGGRQMFGGDAGQMPLDHILGHYAEREYREAMRLRSDYPEAHYNYAMLLEAGGRVDEAEQHYHEALRISPNYAEAHNNLAVLLHGKADLDGAAAHYEAALKLRPQDPETNHNFALVAQARGDADLADHHFRLARELAAEITEGRR